MLKEKYGFYNCILLDEGLIILVHLHQHRYILYNAVNYFFTMHSIDPHIFSLTFTFMAMAYSRPWLLAIPETPRDLAAWCKMEG